MIAPALLEVTKGHGTQNDFVLIDDRHDEVDLSAKLVRALTDRRAGVGADGVIRVVPSTSVPEGARVLAEDASATWFMDYRNADGSVAEMCGNGVRVFVLFLERLGLVDAGAAEVAVGTRAGVRRVRREPNGWYAVDMGRWALPGGEPAAIQAEMDRISAAREASQPLRSKTGGSTFKNPDGAKAWELVDKAGCRGLTMGGAQVSEKHTNFLINTGEATSAEIEALGEEVRKRVKNMSGVELEWEIKRIGRP